MTSEFELRWLIKRYRTKRGDVEVLQTLQYRRLEAEPDSEGFKALRWSKWRRVPTAYATLSNPES